MHRQASQTAITKALKLTILSLLSACVCASPALADVWRDDVSGLSRTSVQAEIHAPAEVKTAELALAALVKSAAARGDKISIAGARHSMGGHTLYPGGLVVDMLPFRQLRYEAGSDSLYVGAGALWTDIIAYLRPFGRTVAIMQSNNAFSVGGSLSVNCHGWQANKPPIASSVKSLRLMTADGKIHTLSRTQQPELFSLVLGGYGLFGIILEAELAVVPDEAYTGLSEVMPAIDYVAAFERLVNQDPEAVMAYGRLRVDPEGFLKDAILTRFAKAPVGSKAPPPPGPDPLFLIKHAIFRNSVASTSGKQLRWELESRFGQFLGQRAFQRSQLLDQPLDVIKNEESNSSDLLHEYFIPKAKVGDFIKALQTIIPLHRANLLNITLRNVLPDQDTQLAYAREEVFGFVMLFNQPHTEAGEAAMQALTQDLIDAALGLDGTYYLPYRLHATPEQFRRAYPMADEFFAAKRRYDPGEVFQNQFYLKYGKP